jgi:site-specific DNA-methyltransferase (adenine-specific)
MDMRDLPKCYRCESQPCQCDDGITIYHSDAMRVLLCLPSDLVDAVVTDPPYSSGGLTRSDRSKDPADKYVQTGTEIIRSSFSGDGRDARSWCYWSALWISEALRTVKEHGYLLAFTDWRQLPMASDAIQSGGFIWRGVISWDKTEGARAPHTGYFRHQCEYVVWGTRGVSKASDHGGPWPGAYRVPIRQADKFHLTGKPTELMRDLVQCVPGDGIVLDPFGGSGTTAVACKLEHRRCITIEQELANCSIAAKRLKQEVLF